MTSKEIFKKICKFVESYGESFTDRFTHDNVKDASWAFWLLGKGFNEKANEIIKLILESEYGIDQETLYEIYPEQSEDNEEWSEEYWNKNMMLQAEFLSSTPFYLNKVEQFFKKSKIK